MIKEGLYMCNFFSFSTNGRGKIWYFTDADIKIIRKEGNPDNLEFNSHASLSSYYKFNEDKANKYEYNPLIKRFTVDQINTYDDRGEAESWVRGFFNKMTRKQILAFAKLRRTPIDYVSLKNNLGDIPTKVAVINRIKRIENIDWFKPLTPNKRMVSLKVNAIFKTFKIPFKCSITYNKLETITDWDAARDAARDAAWNAAWGAAWGAAWNAARGAAWGAAWNAARDAAKGADRDAAKGADRDAAWDAAMDAAWEVSRDKNTECKVNPFGLLIDLWEMGYYVCGLTNDHKFTLYYVPKNDKRRKEERR